jgi:hypothetical protein
MKHVFKSIFVDFKVPTKSILKFVRDADIKSRRYSTIYHLIQIRPHNISDSIQKSYRNNQYLGLGYKCKQVVNLRIQRILKA